MFWIMSLKEKFSSGIEGALASTLNRDFNYQKWFFVFFVMFSKFIWVTLIQKQQEEKRRKKEEKRRLWILGVGATLYYDLKYNR